MCVRIRSVDVKSRAVFVREEGVVVGEERATERSLRVQIPNRD